MWKSERWIRDVSYRSTAMGAMTRRELQAICKQYKSEHGVPCNTTNARLSKLVAIVDELRQGNKQTPYRPFSERESIELLPSIVRVVGNDTVSALRRLVPHTWVSVLTNAYREHGNDLDALSRALHDDDEDDPVYQPFRE